MNTVDALRSERNGRTIPLARFYSEFRSESINICYGFVEGKDDPSYYRTIINNHLPEGCYITLYSANGKEAVKYIYEELSKRDYPSDRISFFMDRDLSCIIDDPNIIENRRVYITDNYSIENDILSEDTLVNVMQDILGFSFATIDELNKVKEFFKTEKKRFEVIMIPIMATIIYWKRKDLKRANYGNLKIKSLISLKNCIVSQSCTVDEMIRKLYIQSGVDYDEHDQNVIDDIISEITENDLSKQILRGKYLATFFIEFCNSLYDNYANIGIISRDKGRKLGANDIMDVVAPRSKPPRSLLLFIEDVIVKYYKKVIVSRIA